MCLINNEWQYLSLITFCYDSQADKLKQNSFFFETTGSMPHFASRSQGRSNWSGLPKIYFKLLKMNNVNILVNIFIVLGICMSKVSWRLELGVQSGEYKLPQGLEKDDYTPMSILKEVADEVISNNNKLLEMKENHRWSGFSF